MTNSLNTIAIEYNLKAILDILNTLKIGFNPINLNPPEHLYYECVDDGVKNELTKIETIHLPNILNELDNLKGKKCLK